MNSGEPALYFMPKTDIKCFSIPQGSYSADIVNPFNGRIPSQLVCGIVDTRSYHGDYSMSCLKFEHCCLRAIKCLVDGSHLGQSPIYTRYGDSEIESDFVQAYNSLKGFGGVPNCVPFSMTHYYKRTALYRFLSEEEDSMFGFGSNSGTDILPLRREGNLKLTLQFDQALKEPKTVMLFGQFSSGFKVTSNREVLIISG